MDKDVQVSIIIPTYDYKDDIFNCIDSVKSSDFKNIEIIVIDNGSNDGTAQALKRFEDITLVESQKNLGVSGGRNAGIKYISGSSRYILFLDHDITL